MRRLSLGATILLGMAVFAAEAQIPTGPVVRGIVADSSGRRVAFARASGEGIGERVADDSGRFMLTLPRTGPVTFEVRRLGYRPLTAKVNVTGDTTLRFTLEALPASLARVQIEAEETFRSLESAGFYRRLRDKEIGANTGHFVLPEEIEQRRGPVLSLMAGTPGVRIARYKIGGGDSMGHEYMALFGTSRKIGSALCPMTIYLDRSRMQPPAEAGGALGSDTAPPPDVSEYVSLREVAGVEIYTRSNAPPEFSLLNGTCGVILIWTK